MKLQIFLQKRKHVAQEDGDSVKDDRASIGCPKSGDNQAQTCERVGQPKP